MSKHKPKLISAIVIMLFLHSINSVAQKFYLDISIGGSYDWLKKKLGDNYEYNGNNLSTDNRIGNGSYGKGTNYNLSLGYKLNNYISLEMGFSYLNGKSYQWDTSWSNTYYWNNNLITETYSNSSKWYSTMTRLTPSILLSLKKRLFTPYAKLGLIIKIGGTITNIQGSNYSGPQSLGPDSTITQFYGGYSFGVMATIGNEVAFPNKTLSFFFEFVIIDQLWAPSYSEIIQGQSTSYNNSYKIDYLNNVAPYFNPNFGQTSVAPKYYNPFSSIGFNIGVKYSFGKKKEEEKKIQ
jgi:hypothetical protein